MLGNYFEVNPGAGPEKIGEILEQFVQFQASRE
jgi:hypothetical protein